jgi:hypothetical protein
MEYKIGKSYLITEKNHPPYIMKVAEIVDDGEGIRGFYHLPEDKVDQGMGYTPIKLILGVEEILDNVAEQFENAKDQIKSVQMLFQAICPDSDDLIRERMIEINVMLSDLITELEGNG